MKNILALLLALLLILPASAALAQGASAFSTVSQSDGSVWITGRSDRSAELIIPAELDGKPVSGIAAKAFRGDEFLISVQIPEGVTYIGGDAFSSCLALETASLPAGLTEIGERAFLFCGSLREIVIPEGVTRIGQNAFAYDSALERAVIPASVAEIGSTAFYECPLLTVYVEPGSFADEYAQRNGLTRDSAGAEADAFSGDEAEMGPNVAPSGRQVGPPVINILSGDPDAFGEKYTVSGSFSLTAYAEGPVDHYLVHIEAADGTVLEDREMRFVLLSIDAGRLLPGAVYTARVGAAPADGGEVLWSQTQFVLGEEAAAGEGEASPTLGTIDDPVPMGEAFTFETEITPEGSARTSASDADYGTARLRLTVLQNLTPDYFAAKYSTTYALSGEEAGVAFSLELLDSPDSGEIIPQKALRFTLEAQNGEIAVGYQLMDAEIGGNYGVPVGIGETKSYYKRFPYSVDPVMEYLVLTRYVGGQPIKVYFALGPADQLPADSPPAGEGILMRGDSGEDVAALQILLVEHNYLLGQADGRFTTETEAAVKRVQAHAGLTQTGVADPETLAFLEEHSLEYTTESDVDALLYAATMDSDGMRIHIKNTGRRPIIAVTFELRQCDEDMNPLGNFYGVRDSDGTENWTTTTTTNWYLITGRVDYYAFALAEGSPLDFSDGTRKYVQYFPDGVYARVTLTGYTTVDGVEHTTNQTVHCRFR